MMPAVAQVVGEEVSAEDRGDGDGTGAGATLGLDHAFLVVPASAHRNHPAVQLDVRPFERLEFAAAKAGVVMFSKHLASEMAEHGIRVNCLAPSAVLNERMQAAMTGQQLDELGASFPLGRIGQPADIGNAVLYLASDAASWITGVTLDITGGRVII